ncbi:MULTISPECIES: dienelactone hydrolase family protein [unclassified Streptomyces]|uniref:dienelactone hydrolase family protein n=1 Tax=unclassified Streptomyces TaxID=2593676 RepID=UPI00278C5451|nr:MULTISPECIES: dienelactone hydrolase family protein [unclassified Streptomyces]
MHIPTSDGQADAFVAHPDDGARHPGVLLYMDAFGVRPVIEELARELAGHGYYVLAPNVYYRRGATPVVELPEHISEENRPEIFGKLMPLLEEHTAERALSDADAYVDFLTAQAEVADGGIGVTGYCMGAALALRTASARPDRVAAVAGFHPGMLVTDAPDSAHLSADKVAARVHLGLAEGDLTPEAVAELNKSFEAAGVEHAIELYPGSVHGFTMADTSAFDADALKRHWDRLLPLLDGALRDAA